jgi:hypothetical protein
MTEGNRLGELAERDAFLHELDLVAPNIRASHNNTVFSRQEIMRAFDRYRSRLRARGEGTLHG